MNSGVYNPFANTVNTIIWLVVWKICLFFHSVGNVIIPIDFLFFFLRGIGIPPTNYVIRSALEKRWQRYVAKRILGTWVSLWSVYWLISVSIDWFKGKITGKSHILWEILWFPVDFPLGQPIDSVSPRDIAMVSPPGLLLKGKNFERTDHVSRFCWDLTPRKWDNPKFYRYVSGWWFGIFLFFHILGIIIPID